MIKGDIVATLKGIKANSVAVYAIVCFVFHVNPLLFFQFNLNVV